MTMRKLVSLPVLMVLLATFAFAQGAATGDLHVTVKDPKGNVVTNATVTARNQAKGCGAFWQLANGQGNYRVLLLPPATYWSRVEATGFAKVEDENVSVTVGQMAQLPVALSVAAEPRSGQRQRHAELVETQRSSSTTDTIEPAAHRQSADQRPQLHQFRAYRLAGAAR